MTDLYSLELYDTLMMDAIEQSDIRLVKHIIKKVQQFSPSETSAVFNKALNQAAEHGFLEAVQLLIPLSNPQDNGSSALRWAATYGHTECVRTLIPVSNPGDEKSHALTLAAEGGHAQCVELLMAVSKPKDMYSNALKAASEGGHVECVQLLVEVSDFHTESLIRAVKNGFFKSADILCPYADMEKSVKIMKDVGVGDLKIQWLEDKIVERNNLRLNTTLTSELKVLGVERSRLKI